MFFIKILYYSLLAFTALLGAYYVYEGLLGRGGGLPYMRQLMAAASLPVFALVYRAYLAGDRQAQWGAAFGYLLLCWLVWALGIGLYFLIFKK